MILFDTHIWVWWVHGGQKLSETAKNALERREESGLGLNSVIVQDLLIGSSQGNTMNSGRGDDQLICGISVEATR